MQMYWWKKKKCRHDWHELTTKNEEVLVLIANEIEIEHHDFTYIYCPKCDESKKVYTEEWLRIKKAQEIKRQYFIDEK